MNSSGLAVSLCYRRDAAGKRKTIATLYFLLSFVIERAEERPLQLRIHLNSSHPVTLYRDERKEKISQYLVESTMGINPEKVKVPPCESSCFMKQAETGGNSVFAAKARLERLLHL